MKMYEIQPMGTLATLLDKFNDLGGVLDYVLIALAGPIPSDCNPYDLHKAAAVFTVQTAYARNPDYPGRGPRIETEKAHGAQITPVDFFAPRYVWVDSTDLSASPYVGIINPGELLTLPDLLALPQAQKEGGIYVSTQGYAWAFSDPPYGLATHEVENLFHEINQQLFGDDLAALTIQSWSTGWAGYFDPGSEWWGSFLWTVNNTNTGSFVGIAAAATDQLNGKYALCYNYLAR